MSADNVEIVKEGFDAFNQRGIDGIAPMLHPGFEATTRREFRAVGDRVLVDFTLKARGDRTGLEFGQDAFMVWELRDGKAYRLDLYAKLEDALEAAGGEGG